MGNTSAVHKVKLVLPMFTSEVSIWDEVLHEFTLRFGAVDYASPLMPFNYTNYYQAEMGSDLTRGFASFNILIAPGELPGIKVYSNQLEEKYGLQQAGKLFRRINLDPGYLDAAKFVLASTKDYSHRIYLNQGIYAEVTLYYQNKTYRPWPWTYPDYRSQDYLAILNHIRSIYMEQIRNAAKGMTA